MPSDEREKIMEKRSSLRGWRERGGKMPGRGELVGGAVVVLVFLALIASAFWGMPQGSGSSPAGEQKKAPE